MKTIIVPTDFSAISINAAYYAVDMARAIHADIILAHSISIPIANSEIYVPPDTFETMTNDSKEDIQNLKEELIQYSKNEVNISVIVTTGNLMEDLQDLETQIDTFSIIMGMQGTGATERLLFGSNALAAMHKLSAPVIIIPRQVHFTNILKIGMACDMKDVVETIPIEAIEKLITLFGCTLDILYINKQAGNIRAEVLSASANLQDILASIHPKFHFINNENIETGISEFTEHEEIDLLLIIPKEHGFPGSVFHKSISKKIALHPRIPIMTMHT